MSSGRVSLLLVVAVASLVMTVMTSVTGFAEPAGQAARPAITKTPFQTPDTSACPYKLSPPAPVDRSEAPAPGQSPPPAVPLPEHVVGGARMAECGMVLPDAAPALPADLTPNAWLLADLDSGAVLAAKDPHGRHRPASTIKILTALVALRELDLKTEVIGTEDDANQEGSRVGLGAEGRYTVDLLLHGLLMRSGNDAAHALANQLGGVPATVQKMDALAHELGAFDTRVSTPSGLDGPGTSTSAFDLALIFRAAMGNQAFVSIVRSTLIDFPGFKDKPGFKVANDNKLLSNYPGALGGKTGFTDDARHTYVGAAQRGNRRLLVVLLRGEQEPIPMWQQAARLLDYGFALPTGIAQVGTLVYSPPKPESPAQLPTVPAWPSAFWPDETVAADIAADPPPGSASAARSWRSTAISTALLALLTSALLGVLWRRRGRSRSTST